MNESLVQEFLATFEDNQYPAELLQRYEIMECLVHNDLGETLLVKDLVEGKPYIAKCYYQNALLAKTNESALLSHLNHPGLPKYFAEFENDAMRCVIREYAPGKPLDELMRESRMASQDCFDIAIQVCEILEYLHGQTPPIIHRDIKPQNIVMDARGKITLIDFGISRAYDDSAGEDTLCFGTRHYAAPEQYGFSQTDCRSDIYSLGVLLCWLFTGQEDIGQAKKEIPSKRLIRIIDRCTAFDPKNRFENVTQVRDALTGRTTRRNLWIGFFALLVIVPAVYFLLSAFAPQFVSPGGVGFKEPLIEQAVRLALGKTGAEAITEEDLLSVNAIFIFGDQVAADQQGFDQLTQSFVRNDGTVKPGTIRNLDDLKQLKNLRWVTLADQQITDLTALASLSGLENVDLRHNPVSDVSPLANLPQLTILSLFDTGVTDLNGLSVCHNLTTLDVGSTPIESTAAVERLSSLHTLQLRKSALRSLDKVDRLVMLENLYLSETRVTDLSPLLSLPSLEKIEVDKNMRSAADAIAGRAHFEIVYP